VETALQMARQSRREAHATVAVLRNLSTEQPLSEVLAKTISQQLRAKHLQFSVTSANSIPRLGIEVETQILRIAQEAVANTLQHSHASNLEVNLSMEGPDLVLSLHDDGVGFDTNDASHREGAHFGILGMEERAKAIRASLTIQSTAKGTSVRLVVPEIDSRLGLESRLGDAAHLRAFGGILRKRVTQILQRKVQA